MELVGGRPGAAWDRGWWEPVQALFELCFPGLPAGIRRAARAGARWEEVSTPFVLVDAGRPLCHVGVLVHPMVLGGRAVEVAGLHAVCTHPDHRRRGLVRTTLEAALAWVDGRSPIAKLHTDLPEVYAGHGFRPVPTWRFRVASRPDPGVARRLLHPSRSPADAALLADMLARREPVSFRCSTADPGWMVTIVAALGDRLDSSLWHLPDHEAIVAIDRQGDTALVLDVIAPRLPPVGAILAVAPGPALWTFPPDRLDPTAHPVQASPAVGTLMVRGSWPGQLAPIGLSPLWEH